MYGAIYGAIVNIQDKKIVKEISDIIIQKQFSAEIEFPHILIRDYARGIIEYAGYLVISIDNIERCRPPYKSKWPLENPLPSEINKLDPESNIQHYIQSYISDFGKYVLKDVEKWTATPIVEKSPDTGRELQYRFAETLPENLKLRFTQLLDQKVEEEKRWAASARLFWDDIILEVDPTDHNSENDNSPKSQEDDDLVYDTENEDLDVVPPMITKTEKEIIEEIVSSLEESEREYFKWVRKQGISDHPAKFDFNWGCRWVIKRVYDLGWTKELFNDFEEMYCRNRYGKNKGVVERIGKKYQWIAFYELLARLADNLIFCDRGYCDVDDSRFFGPWQIDIREMDPTYWHKAKSKHFYDDNEKRWWRPYQFSVELSNLDEQLKWLWDASTLPHFKSVVCAKNYETNEEWLVLHSFCDWKTRAIKDKSDLGEPNLWYRINTCIIEQENLEVFKKKSDQSRITISTYNIYSG